MKDATQIKSSSLWPYCGNATNFERERDKKGYDFSKSNTNIIYKDEINNTTIRTITKYLYYTKLDILRSKNWPIAKRSYQGHEGSYYTDNH